MYNDNTVITGLHLCLSLCTLVRVFFKQLVSLAIMQLSGLAWRFTDTGSISSSK